MSKFISMHLGLTGVKIAALLLLVLVGTFIVYAESNNSESGTNGGYGGSSNGNSNGSSNGSSNSSGDGNSYDCNCMKNTTAQTGKVYGKDTYSINGETYTYSPTLSAQYGAEVSVGNGLNYDPERGVYYYPSTGGTPGTPTTGGGGGVVVSCNSPTTVRVHVGGAVTDRVVIEGRTISTFPTSFIVGDRGAGNTDLNYTRSRRVQVSTGGSNSGSMFRYQATSHNLANIDCQEAVPPPTAFITQTKASTLEGEAFSVSYGRSGTVTATRCELQMRVPGAAATAFNEINRNTGGTTAVPQRLNNPGTHTYRARCYNASGYSSFVQINHTVREVPPTAVITQSKATTKSGEAFTVRYRPGVAGSATRCELHRRIPGGTLVLLDSNSGVNETVTQAPSTPGSYQYSARCQNSRGWSPWATISHTVINLSCSVSPTSTSVNQTVTWRATANPSGGVAYQWTGTDGLTGSVNPLTRAYSTAGTKTAQVRAALNGAWTSWQTCSNSVTVTEPIVANLFVCPVTTANGSCTATSLTVNPDDQAKLRWNTTGGPATSCTALPNAYNFSTGGLTASVDTDIIEPLSSSSNTYRISCTGPGGSDTDSVTITTRAGTGSCIDAQTCPGGGDPDDDPETVSKGGSIPLEYNTGTSDPQRCVLRAGEVTIDDSLTQSGTITVTPTGETVYTIYCDDGGNTDSIKVKVLPEVQET